MNEYNFNYEINQLINLTLKLDNTVDCGSRRRHHRPSRSTKEKKKRVFRFDELGTVVSY